MPCWTRFRWRKVHFGYRTVSRLSHPYNVDPELLTSTLEYLVGHQSRACDFEC